MVSSAASIFQGNPGPSRSTVVPRVTCNHINYAPVGRCTLSHLRSRPVASLALPLPSVAATSAALWPSARFEAQEHVFRIAWSRGQWFECSLGGNTSTLMSCFLASDQKGPVNFLGDEDTSKGVIRLEDAANSNRGQISLKLLALVLDEAGRATQSAASLQSWCGQGGFGLWVELPLEFGCPYRDCITTGKIP